MEAAVITIQQKFGTQLHHIICKKVGHQDLLYKLMINPIKLGESAKVL